MTTTPPVTTPPATQSSSSPVQQVLRLFVSEMRLFARETQALIFVFGFPALTVLVLGGVFGNEPDDSGFEFVNPSHFYVSAYFGVMLAAIGLIMLPAHVATTRQQGVLRRYDTAGFPSWAFATTQFLCGLVFAALGSVSLVITAALSYGIPTMQDPTRAIVGLVVGALAFISLGVALGSILPSGRAAQALGLTMFFPMFLLSGGGPPPEALDGAMRTITNWMPLTHVIRASQEPWLDLGTGTNHLLIVAAIGLVSTVIWVRQSRWVSRSL